jgi:hypothetical protein
MVSLSVAVLFRGYLGRRQLLATKSVLDEHLLISAEVVVIRSELAHHCWQLKFV